MNQNLKTKKFSTESLADLEVLSGYLQAQLGLKTLVLLSGPLGAGKTELVKQWGKDQFWSNVTSPTYSFVNFYGDDVRHWDLYRVESLDELESLGFWDQFSEEKALIIVEWPERVNEKLWPLDWKIIKVVFDIESKTAEVI